MKIINQVIGIFLVLILASCQDNKNMDYSNYDTYPVYEGNDLGLTYTTSGSRFRIYAPTAEIVKLLIYEEGLGGEPLEEYNMQKAEHGTWTLDVEKDLKGMFYTYRVRHDGDWLDETPGIYAKAVGVNGLRAAVVDLDETDPEGWENDRRPDQQNYNDIIVYEIQVRDMSIHPNSGIEHRGKYLGLTETDTRSPEGQKTGLDHLTELGVTHVHILPAFDFRSIDETRLDENDYNWGYDPENYNVPEGSFSTNPYNPETRIREFKQMVKAFHDAGIRVIMDVVYNHTGKTANSNFNLMVPGYYYRHNNDGSFSDASACGNETASERPMMRKYMIESLKHWVNEYHVDGFRFDLMGIHDIETMNMISEELHAIDPTIFLYGEGWTAAGSPLPENRQALKKYTCRLDSIAAFSDDVRDGIKGSWNNHESKGFVSGAPDLEESVKFGVAASINHPQVVYEKVNYSDTAWAAEPFQTMTYVSCHDNHTLLDKLKISNPNASEEELIAMHKLANTIVMTSQGVPFLHAGVDFLRTKQGVENSYDSPDSINQIDWSRKHQYREVFDYYRDLVTLRQEHPAFRMSSAEDIRKNLRFIETGTPGVVAFILKDYTNGDSWKNIVVIYNASKKEQIVRFPFAKWTEVFNAQGLNKNGYRTFKHDQVKVPAVSAMVLAEVVPERY